VPKLAWGLDRRRAARRLWKPHQELTFGSCRTP
jgi:hypothetical protein